MIELRKQITGGTKQQHAIEGRPDAETPRPATPPSLVTSPAEPVVSESEVEEETGEGWGLDHPDLP